MNNTPDCLELMVFETATGQSIVGFARRNGAVHVSERQTGNAIRDLIEFTARLKKAVEPGAEGRPTKDELLNFGNRLFDFCFADKAMKDIYSGLPQSHVRLQFLTCHHRIKSIPWEYMQEPQRIAGPRLFRSVVRIVPTSGSNKAISRSAKKKLRVLFLASYPIDQQRVSWQAIERRIERSFLPYTGSIELEKRVPCTIATFRTAVAAFRPDVIHFSGHGRVGPSGTELVFMKPESGESAALTSDEIVTTIQDRDVRLVVLSACETSTQPRVLESAYSVLAEELVRSGISAVVANQLPVADDTTSAFAGPLYQTLLETGDIDLAVAEGRQALFNLLNNTSPSANFEWGIPTIHRQISGSRILTV